MQTTEPQAHPGAPFSGSGWAGEFALLTSLGWGWCRTVYMDGGQLPRLSLVGLCDLGLPLSLCADEETGSERISHFLGVTCQQMAGGCLPLPVDWQLGAPLALRCGDGRQVFPAVWAPCPFLSQADLEASWEAASPSSRIP